MRILYRVFPFILGLGLWQVVTLWVSPMVLPSPAQVFQEFLAISGNKDFYSIIFVTMGRFFAGLSIGIFIGSLLGFLFGLSKPVETIMIPFISFLQAVPPVSWVVLALVWFGFNGKPSVFIVATATIPAMVINISNGIQNIDKDLLDMARLYHFSKYKTLYHIILPSIYPYFQSALEIVIGNGWKLVVMGEVLTTSTGIGGAITTARLNIESAAIIAWALLLVIFCFATQQLLRLIIGRKVFSNAND